MVLLFEDISSFWETGEIRMKELLTEIGKLVLKESELQFDLNESDELFDTYNFDLLVDSKLAGNFEIFKFYGDYDPLHSLDSIEDTSCFMSLFGSSKVLEKFGFMDFDFFILNKCFLEENFRGHKILPIILRRIFNYTGAGIIGSTVLLNAVPQGIDKKNFIQDREKLANYYKSLGFIELHRDQSNLLMGFNAGYLFKNEKSI